MKNQRSLILIGGLLTFVALFPPGLSAKPFPLNNFDHPRLIETQELFNLMDHPSLRIVDMRTSLSDYLKGHIPGAVYLHFENTRFRIRASPTRLLTGSVSKDY